MQEIDQEQFPFITGLTYAKSEYYGIVVNYDNTILTMYDLSKMPNKEPERFSIHKPRSKRKGSSK